MTMIRRILMSGIAAIAIAGTAGAAQEHHPADPNAPAQGAPSGDMPAQRDMQVAQSAQPGMGMPCMTGQGMMGQGMMGQGMGQGGMMCPGMMGGGMMGQGGMMNMPMMGQGMMGQGGMGMMCPGMMGGGMMGQGGMQQMPMMGQGMMGQGGMGQGMMGQGGMGQGGMGMMGGGMMGQAPGADAGDAMSRLMADRVEGRIAFLRAELQITEQQAAAWDGFAAALRGNAKSMAEMRGSAMGAGAPQALPERLELMEKMLSARLAGIAAVKSSLAALYGVLSEEQKRTADELLSHPMFLGRMAMGMP